MGHMRARTWGTAGLAVAVGYAAGCSATTAEPDEQATHVAVDTSTATAAPTPTPTSKTATPDVTASGPSPTSLEDTAPPELDGIQWVVADGVSERERAEVARMLAIAVHDIGARTGHRIDEFEVRLYPDPDTYVTAEATRLGVSEDVFRQTFDEIQSAGGTSGLLLMAFNRNANLVDRPDNVAQMVAHEYVHVLQYALVYGPGRHEHAVSPPPTWLLEGTAEWLVERMWADVEQAAKPCHPDCLIDAFDGELQAADGISRRVEITLPSIESRDGMAKRSDRQVPGYSLGMLAADRLVRAHGPASLLDFYAASATRPWREAFAVTFGQPVGEFYDDFAAWHAAGGP